MSKAALARGLGLCYVACTVVTNWAVGKFPSEIAMAGMKRDLVAGMDKVKTLLTRVLPTLDTA